jgi:hypothetical protein
MLTDDENDYLEKAKKRIDREAKRLTNDASREEFMHKAVPVFTQILDEAFRKAGLVKSKAMTTLLTELMLQDGLASVEQLSRIIADFGDFSREAGLGPDPLRVRK